MKYSRVESKSALLAGHAVCIASIEDQCFIMTVGQGTHAQAAAQFACDTASWGFRAIGQRGFYWLNKMKLLERMFRTTNIALYQKQRETGLSEGYHAGMALAIIGHVRQIWLGTVGLPSIYYWDHKTLRWLVDTRREHKQPLVLGNHRYGTSATTMIRIFHPGISVCMTEQPIMPMLSESECANALDNPKILDGKTSYLRFEEIA